MVIPLLHVDDQSHKSVRVCGVSRLDGENVLRNRLSVEQSGHTLLHGDLPTDRVDGEKLQTAGVLHVVKSVEDGARVGVLVAWRGERDGRVDGHLGDEEGRRRC